MNSMEQKTQKSFVKLMSKNSISELRMLQEEAEKREQELQEKLRREEEERKERKKGAWHYRQIFTFNSF